MHHRHDTGLTRPRRPVLGTELAGDVVGPGPGVDDVVVGDPVFAWVEGRFGAHAELALVPDRRPVARIPAGIPYRVAAR